MKADYKTIREILVDVRHYLFCIEESMQDDDDLSETVKDNTSNIINITKAIDMLANTEISELQSEITNMVKEKINRTYGGAYHGGFTYVDTDSVKEQT